MHYVVFAHNQAAGSGSSGLCCSDGKDFIVTLGSWERLCVGAGPNGVSNTTRSGNDQPDGQGNITNGAGPEPATRPRTPPRRRMTSSS